MLYHLARVSAHEFGIKVEWAQEAGLDREARARRAVDSAAPAGTPPRSSIRDTVADVAGRLLVVEECAPAAAACERSYASLALRAEAPPTPVVDFACVNRVLAAVAQDGKILIGSRTFGMPGASNPAVRPDILVPAQR